MDVFNQIIDYRLDPAIKEQIMEKYQFDSEDSGFAPEPSVASRVRSECGRDFSLIYIQRTRILMVLGELFADRNSSIEIFLKECPELTPYMREAYPLPPSPYPPMAVIRAYVKGETWKGSDL